MDVTAHVGDAPQWARRLAQVIRAQLEQRGHSVGE